MKKKNNLYLHKAYILESMKEVTGKLNRGNKMIVNSCDLF